jgi:hypothetical protein
MVDDKQLKAHPTIPKPEGPVLVCILDGYGENQYKDEYNAVVQAETPCFDKLRDNAERFRYVLMRVHLAASMSALRDGDCALCAYAATMPWNGQKPIKYF